MIIVPPFCKCLVALTVFASFGFAAGPIATLSSSQPFLLDGHAITVAGVTSWPVVAGDELATAQAPAILYFHDGSSVKLAAGSRVKLSGSAEAPKVVLTSGKLDCQLAEGSKVAVTSAISGAAAKAALGNATGLAARLPPVSSFQ